MAQQPQSQPHPQAQPNQNVTTIRMFRGQYPHVYWLDLDGNGALTECAVMKLFPNGDINYIPLAPLDGVDKERMLRIITNRNAGMYELWDLMSQITLGNGKNALDYFSQLVRAKTASGVNIPVGSGRIGVPLHLLQATAPQPQAPQGPGPYPHQ